MFPVQLEGFEVCSKLRRSRDGWGGRRRKANQTYLKETGWIDRCSNLLATIRAHPPQLVAYSALMKK